MEHHEEHHKKRKGLSKSFYMKIYIVLALALVVFAFYNIYQSSSINTLFEEKLAEVKEATRPAFMLMVVLQDPNCDDCFDLSPVIGSVKMANVNVTKELTLDLSSEKAKELIDKHNVEKIPTILLFGEINKNM